MNNKQQALLTKLRIAEKRKDYKLVMEVIEESLNIND